MTNFLLLITAMFLAAILLPFGFAIGLIAAKSKSEYFRRIAFSLDQHGNAVCGELFNLVLIKKNGYSFGNPDDTISYVLGRNYIDGTLALSGKLLNGILNHFWPNHTINAVNNGE